MPYPNEPTLDYSYTGFEQAQGDGSFPGQEVDVDLANLRTSIVEIIAFLRGFTRSDGQLSNGAVGSDQLDASLRIGFDPPAPWATATDYTTRSTVFEGYGFYLCLVEHTSGVFATDLAAGRWQLLADLTPPASGLVAWNNLSDLTDAATARANLGLGTMAVLDSGTGSTQFRTNAQNDARFQLLDALLTSIGGLAFGADSYIYGTGSDTAAAGTITAFGRSLIDDADAATALTTLGAVATSRIITAGTGLTGGGDLSANRTVSANVASQAEAEAGVSSTKLMTPQRTAQAIAALVSGGGGALKAVTAFTASGTWTPDANATSALIICTGGGGAGTSAAGSTGGGGAGSTAIAFIADTTAEPSRAVTIGAGPAGSGNGGTSSVATRASAGGGNGAVAGGLGGTATVGDLLIPGGNGSGGSADETGGASFWGGSGAYGSGGDGGAGSTRDNGSNGVVLILEW